MNTAPLVREHSCAGGSGENDEDDDEGEEEEEEEEEEEAVEKEEEKEAGASHATVSVTLLAMVEEAVCEIARAFVGTKVRGLLNDIARCKSALAGRTALCP